MVDSDATIDRTGDSQTLENIGAQGAAHALHFPAESARLVWQTCRIMRAAAGGQGVLPWTVPAEGVIVGKP